MFKVHRKQQPDDENNVVPAEETSEETTSDEAAPLSATEKQQFAEWLEKQPPDRRKHYLKLARAYGFPEDQEAEEDQAPTEQ